MQALKLFSDQEVDLKGYQDIFSSGVLSDVALAARLGRLPTEHKMANERERELFRLRWLDAFGLGVYSQVSFCFTVDYDLPREQLTLKFRGRGKTSTDLFNYFKTDKVGSVEVSGKVISFRRIMELSEVRRWARYYSWTLAGPRELEALVTVHDISVECPVVAAGVVLPEDDGGYGIIGLTGSAGMPETCHLERFLHPRLLSNDHVFGMDWSFLVIE